MLRSCRRSVRHCEPQRQLGNSTTVLYLRPCVKSGKKTLDRNFNLTFPGLQGNWKLGRTCLEALQTNFSLTRIKVLTLELRASEAAPAVAQSFQTPSLTKVSCRRRIKQHRLLPIMCCCFERRHNWLESQVPGMVPDLPKRSEAAPASPRAMDLCVLYVLLRPYMLSLHA